MKFAVVVFPGSNCDADCFHIVRDLLGCDADYVWHKETSLKGADAVLLPGGFAYGDYLRAGALARFSPVMESVAAFARSGGPVLGICNGFQVLLEAGLLPGAAFLGDSCVADHLDILYYALGALLAGVFWRWWYGGKTANPTGRA